MGCIHQKPRAISPSVYRNSSLFVDIKEHLSIQIEAIADDFERFIQQKINPSNPKALAEFDEMIKQGIRRSKLRFDEITEKYKEIHECKSHVSFFRAYLKSSCKSKIGIFRNQNNINSCNYLFSLAFEILERLEKQEIDEKEALECFSKQIRGAFRIKGIHIFHSLIALQPIDRKKFLKSMQEFELEKLEVQKEQLLVLDNIYIMPSNSRNLILSTECGNIENSFDFESEFEEQIDTRIRRNSVSNPPLFK